MRILWQSSWLSLMIPAGMLLLSGCGEAGKKPKIGSLDDLNDSAFVVAAEKGAVAGILATRRFPKARSVRFKTGTEMAAELMAGRIDAFAFDRPALEYMAAEHPQLMVLPESLGTGKIAIAVAPQKKELVEPINRVIRSFQKSGVSREMFDRWLKTTRPENPEIPRAARPQAKLVIGLEKEYIPFCYTGAGGAVMGYDVEYAKRLALALNCDCVFRQYEYEELFPALKAGRIDIAVSQIDATTVRQEEMFFSEPYIDSSIGVMIRRRDFAGKPAAPRQR